MPDADPRTLAALRKWSVLLDSAFRVPGTKVTFGFDPILGLIPGVGDFTTPLFAALLLLHSVRLRIPKVIQLKMVMNAAIDLAIGVIPLLGDLFDFAWKGNVRNLALLDVYGRIARTLLHLATASGDKLIVEQKLTHQEIANMVGASREMVSRILKDLANKGYIKVDRKRITINEKLSTTC